MNIFDRFITPVSPLPRGQEQQARLLAMLSLLIALLSALMIVLHLLLHPHRQPNIYEYNLIVVESLTFVLAYGLCRRGKIRTAAYLIVSVLGVLLFYISFLSRENFIHYYSPYLVLLLLMAGFLLPLRAVATIALLTWLFFLGVFIIPKPHRLDEMGIQRLGFYAVSSVELLALTQIRQSQERLRRRELAEGQARYRDLFEATFEAIAVQRKGIYIDVNPAFEEMMGYSREEIIGASIFDLSPSEVRPDLTDKLHTITGEIRYESLGKRKDGSIFPVAIYSKPFVYQNEAARIVAIRDLTSGKQAEQQRLELALQRDRVLLLENLLGDLSHDLKTPISGIYINLGLLEKVEDTTEHQRQISLIKRQLLHVEQLLDNILLMSRLERGTLRQDEQINLNALIKDVAQWLQAQAKARSIDIILQLDERLPTLQGDYSALWRLLLNLVKNSIVYSEAKRSVEISTVYQGDRVRLNVRDQGFGIAAADLPHIFERFYRGSQTKSSSGTGLGLSIVKAIVDAHQGQITVESVPNLGTNFQIVLPLKLNLSTL